MLYRFEDCLFDTERRELLGKAGPIPLEPQVFDLLEYLIRNRTRVVSKDDLRDAIWNGRIVSDSALTTRLNAARSAIGDSGETQRLIRTLPRKGIRFVGEVHVQEADSDEAKSVNGFQVASRAEQDAREHSPTDKPAIAVLPFTNIGGDPEQEYFADGIVEDIITALSRFHSFLVIARNSSFAYKGRSVDIKKVAEELGVRYVLEGSIRKSASHVRITGQLIDAESGGHLWGAKYDGELGELFKLEDKVTASVAAAIEPRVVAAEIARATRKSTSKLAAHDFAMRARPLVATPTQASVVEALRLLRLATDIDPSYALAWAMMALCANNRYILGLEDDSEAAIRDACDYARRAVACDRDDAEVLADAAYVLASVGGEYEEATALLDSAVALNPYSVSVGAFGGWTRICCGDFDDAISLYRTGLLIDPLSPHGLSACLGIAAAHFYKKDYDEAVTWATRAISKNPEMTSAYRYLAGSLAFSGRIDEARAAITSLLARQPNSSLTRSRKNTFRYAWMMEHYLEGLRLAGLPD